MLKFYTLIGLSLITGLSLAKPCTYHKSCLLLKNQHSQNATIQCNWLNTVTSAANSQGSTQLDLGYGDGLGAPEPRSIYCTLRTEQTVRDFNFYNPYWGSFIEFNLISAKELNVRVIDGWSSKEIYYPFKW